MGDPTLVTLLKMQHPLQVSCIVNPVVKMQPHTAKKYINWLRVKKTKPFLKGNQYKTNLCHVKRATCINPLSPNGVQHQYSPNTIPALLRD